MSVVKVASDEEKHDGDLPFIAVHGDYVYSGGSDGKVKIWDLDLNLKKDLIIDDAYIYAMAIDKQGRLYTSSWDGTIKFFENPLESKRYLVLLHEREIEALFCDENDIFFIGDSKGGVIGFENGKFMYRRRNIVEAIKILHVEKDLFYTLTELDMTIHEMDDETGKFTLKGSVTGKFPITFFGTKEDGTSKFIAISTYESVGVTVFKNDYEEKFHRLTIKENLHEFPIVAMKGKGDYLFTSDEEGNLIKSLVICKYEGNEIREEATCVLGPGNATCIAAADDKTVFVGSGDGLIRKVVF